MEKMHSKAHYAFNLTVRTEYCLIEERGIWGSMLHITDSNKNHEIYFANFFLYYIKSNQHSTEFA